MNYGVVNTPLAGGVCTNTPLPPVFWIDTRPPRSRETGIDIGPFTGVWTGDLLVTRSLVATLRFRNKPVFWEITGVREIAWAGTFPLVRMYNPPSSRTGTRAFGRNQFAF